ncbi:MAG: hypothetical protein JNK87_22260 [Bryobacterales bacterium]|nr:hypothetical protein [Bryobacterales bacterium]
MLERSTASRFAGVLLLLALPALAKENPVICGTDRAQRKEAVFLHRQSQALRRKTAQVRAVTGPVGRDYGDIAVMYDGNGVVARRNPFNLVSKKITFTPGAGFTQYRYAVGESAFDQDASEKGGVLAELDDDDTRLVLLPFAFPFYGTTYNEMWVNSDGNVTFGRSDAAPVTRSTGILAGGPPRIAALFVDLDPSRSTRGVRVLTEPGRAVITWQGVPLFGGFSQNMVFQLRLYPDGRVEADYQAVASSDAVIGIAPGDARGETQLVSFLNDASSSYSGALAERFTTSDSLDSVLLAQRFYQTHDDGYDYLVVYNNLGLAARSFAVATTLPVRTTHRAGFGDIPVDDGAIFGSARRLQAFLNMGPLSNYPRDLNAPLPLRFGTGDTPVTVLLHEIGHLFLALASVRDEVDPTRRPMLGNANAHWSFNYNSDASFLEGNRIQDSGETASPRYETVATVERFSAMDQYLMGFRAPSEVPPSFVVLGSNRGNSEPPQKGVTMNGTRRNVTVEEVIAAEGRRSPDHTVAQRRFRIAVLFLMKAGEEPTAEQLEQLNGLRTAAEARFAAATENRATLEAKLQRNMSLSVWPAAGILAGSTLNATVRLDRPAETPLTVVLKTANGVVGAPASVTIPAGAQQAVVALRAQASGVELLTAEPANTAYRVDEARIQVAAPSAVRLELDEESTPGNIVVRATDINLIPYPGIRVQGTVTAGSLEVASVVTDADGMARFRWTPGEANNVFRATVAGSPSTVTLQAAARPVFLAANVVNIGSYKPELSPGTLAAIFGTGLARGQVLVNGSPTAVLYADDGQLTFLIPPGSSGPSVTLVVRGIGGDSAAVTIPLLDVSPGLLFSPATGEAAALVAGTGFLTSQQPAKPGDILEIYATGLGALAPSATYPGLEETVQVPVVTINGMPGAVLFSGGAPGVAGLNQLNVRIPDVGAGVWKLRLSIGGRDSNEADITIQP